MQDLIASSDFIARGGLVVLVIGAGSLLALTVFLFRLWTLRRGRVVPRRLLIQVKDLVVRDEVPEALTLCRMDESPLARVFLAGLRQRGQPRAEIKEFLLEVGRHESMLLQRGLGVLETVAVVSPLLGLLGTVWGMIDVFRTIEVHGVGDAGALAGGIGTALYTTLAGLLVAIPVRVAHSYLLSLVDARVLEMEEAALDLLEVLRDRGPDDREAPSGPRAVVAG